MMLETVRCVTAWLNDPVYGVNAKLLTVPRDAADVAAGALPPMALITDETVNGEIARGRIPSRAGQLPGLALSVFSVDGIDPQLPQGAFREARVTVLIRYGNENATTESGTRDAYYTMRAVLESLTEFHKEANSGSRMRNNVMMYSVDELSMLQLYQSFDDATVTSAAKVTYRTRDLSPV